MLTYAADENSNGVMLRGLFLRALPSLDVLLFCRFGTFDHP